MQLPRTAVAYVRASTCRQQLGPEAQVEQIKRWAHHQKIEITNWHHDAGGRKARSGGLPIEQRPELAAALEAIKAGKAQFLIVDRRDRLGRDLLNALEIEAEVWKAGGRVLAADGTANGESDAERSLRHLLYVFAEMRRAEIKRAIRGVFSLKRQKGEALGGLAIYGFRCVPNPAGVRMLVPDEEEEKVIWAVASLRRRRFSYQAIREELWDRGITNRRKKKLSFALVRAICHRLRLVATGEREGPFPTLTKELARPEVWNLYQRALREQWKIHPTHAAPPDWTPPPRRRRRGSRLVRPEF